jgi:hypothetical protein
MTTHILRLPPEIIDHIFSFIHPSTTSLSPGKRDRIRWLSLAHVCHRWRQIALNQPRFWNFIDFTSLTLAGVTEMIIRTKEAPLHLMADFCGNRCNRKHLDTIHKLLVANTSRIHTFNISAFPHHLSPILARLTSPAPVLESLSLCTDSRWAVDRRRERIPPTLFNSTVPRLIRLELEGCYISWNASLLKGLRHLKLVYHDDKERPNLQSWLDAMCNLSQLESLVLHDATPIAAQPIAPIPEPMQMATLHSLTRLYLSDSATSCALALAHLVLPTLTWLRVDVMFTYASGKDLRTVLPHFVRNAHGPQDTTPLQSMVINGCATRTDILLWSVPDADMRYDDNDTFTRASLSARAVFTAFCPFWDLEKSTAVCRTVLSALPLMSLSTLTVLDYMAPPKAFWLANGSQWPLLKRVRLGCETLCLFTGAGMEHSPRAGVFFPYLKTLVITGPLGMPDAAVLRYFLVVRANEGIPIRALDLSECGVAEGAMRFFSDTITDIREPEKTGQLQDLVWPATLVGWDTEYFSDWSDEEDEDEDDSQGEHGWRVRYMDDDFWE